MSQEFFVILTTLIREAFNEGKEAGLQLSGDVAEDTAAYKSLLKLNKIMEIKL